MKNANELSSGFSLIQTSLAVVIFGILLISLTHITKINLAAIKLNNKLENLQSKQAELIKSLNLKNGHVAGFYEFCQKYDIDCIHIQGDKTQAISKELGLKLPVMPDAKAQSAYVLP